MSKEKNFGNKINSNGFDKRPQDATKGGRKPSIRKQLEEILQEDGAVTFSAKQVQEIREDGSVVIKVPTQMQMALKMVSWAMSKKGNDSIRAIQMVMEQIDGKPKQSVDLTSNDNELKSIPIVLADGRTYEDLKKELREDL